MIPSELAKQILEEVPKLEGWQSPERGIEMAELIFDNQVRFAVDIGTFGGRSSIPMALAMKHQIGSLKGLVLTIDPWRHESAQTGESAVNREYWGRIPLEEIHQEFMAALRRLRLEEYLIPVRSRSMDVFTFFCGHVNLGTIDLLNIDGNHTETESFKDASCWLQMVRAGGIIIADDLDWTVDGVPSTVKMREFIESQCDTIKCDGHYGIYKKR